jgi:hypothetical protein
MLVVVFFSAQPLKQLDKPQNICYVSTVSNISLRSGRLAATGGEWRFTVIAVVQLLSGGSITKNRTSK